ncbi:MAG TPA: hypothetical protein VGO47_08010, partial [Chlamydiales bacterium]|nr:hypothetical protein [Chlamydiales bacterium]
LTHERSQYAIAAVTRAVVNWETCRFRDKSDANPPAKRCKSINNLKLCRMFDMLNDIIISLVWGVHHSCDSDRPHHRAIFLTEHPLVAPWCELKVKTTLTLPFALIWTFNQPGPNPAWEAPRLGFKEFRAPLTQCTPPRVASEEFGEFARRLVRPVF